MSVTGLGPTNSRNEAVIYTAPTGCACGALVLIYQGVDHDAQAVGEAKPLGLHCLTCHSRNHNACVGCGACLPDWSPLPPLFPDEPRRRLDARYCSNACRQRAYRKRKAAR